MFDLMLTPDFLSWVKRSDIEIVPKSFLIEPSGLIGVGYNLSDTQDGLRCLERWELYFVVIILSSWQGLRWVLQGPLFYFHLPKYFVFR